MLIAALSRAAVASPPMYFARLGGETGLAQGGVMAILQDVQGFLWLGTEDGLDRYDGYELKHYTHDRNHPGSLPNSWVSALAEDSHGTLWIGTDGGGLVGRDPATGAFESLPAMRGQPALGPQEIVQVVRVDRHGRIWVGTRDGGLVAIDRATGSARRFRHTAGDNGTLSGDCVLAVFEDHNGTIWVGTRTGLDRLDPATGRIEHQTAVMARLASVTHGDTQVSAILEDQRGDFWFGTKGGLVRLESGSGAIAIYRSRTGDDSSLPGDRVQAILEDSGRRLWVGTSNGLALYDRRRDAFDTYRHDAADSATLPDDNVISLYEDRGGLLWVGTKTGGVAKWNSRSWSFGRHAGTAEGFGDANPTAFAVDASGVVWIATLGGGLHAIDRQHGTIRHFRHVATDPASLPDDRVMALLLDHDGALWLGTMTAGLSRLDPHTERFTTYRHDPANPATLGAAGVMSLLEDSRGRIWVGTFGGGLAVLDRATGKFKRYASDPNDPSTLASDRATALAEDSSGRIWVGTDGGGLCLLDPASGRFVRFAHSIESPRALTANTVYAIRVDERGHVWVGTRGGGLDEVVGSALLPGTISFRSYAEAEGLPNATIYGIELDANRRLWLSTNRGLSRFDPATREVRNFRRAHGLQGDEFNFGAHYRSADGELFFGGPGGYNAFFPERLQFNDAPPPVVLTTLLTRNEPARTAVPHDRLRRIALGYRDEIVTFEFAALDFASPEDNRYFYMLEGFDPGWVDAGSRRRVTYTNLDGGHYTFRVRAANSDGSRNEHGLAIPLDVEPPPWARPWARAGYVLALALLIFGVWHSQHRKLRREAQYAQRLAQDVRDRTAELALRNEDLERANRQLREASITDPLTGLGNRRYLRETMAALVAPPADAASGAVRAAAALGMLIVDLDHLKPINDMHGHESGDRILVQVAEILRRCCRTSDLIVRWGGDEFVVVYRDADLGAAEVLAERIRSRVAKQIFPLTAGKAVRTSCSIGFTRYPFVADAPDFLTWEQCLSVADAALYQAKRQRNGWIGWAGTAAARDVPSILRALAADPEALEREGCLDVRRPGFRPQDTVDGLPSASRRRGDP